MPMYEYECQKCKNIFEKIVFGSDKDTVSCPKCKSEKVKKILSSASFIASSASAACSPAVSSRFS